MRIARADIIPVTIPFEDGGSGSGLMPVRWDVLHMVLLRLEDDRGHVGWGEGFCYFHQATVATALREMVLPLVLDQEVEDIAVFTRIIQKRLHLFGRYGVTMFAISALDIALWDLLAKRAGEPLAAHLGGIAREAVPVYASMVRYSDPALIEQISARAMSQGYAGVKLHEIDADCIYAGRIGAGEGTKLATDVNCNWSLQQTRELLPKLKTLGLYWCEEPVFPPDDEVLLGALQAEFGVAIASGENACTRVEFKRLTGSIEFIQPSVTKVGGVSEFLDVCKNAAGSLSKVMPHCPYFGPGYWASLHLMAHRAETEMFEFLYVEPEAWLDPAIPLPKDGMVRLPERPGLGFEPDEALLERYQVKV